MLKTKTEINKNINESLKYLKKKLRISSAYIFGSYATGNATEWSDIDLAVFSPDVDRMKIEDKAKLFSDLKLHGHKDVELHLFTKKVLKEARPTNFCGYILNSGIKVI